jgi:K(+)-stimulated pyrophosphate-energized sodium pump
VSILCGLIVGVIIGETSDYFTSNRYSPAKRVAAADQGGPAIGILTGFSLGMFVNNLASILSPAVAAFLVAASD